MPICAICPVRPGWASVTNTPEVHHPSEVGHEFRDRLNTLISVLTLEQGCFDYILRKCSVLPLPQRLTM